jgi:hypothetical protein
VVPAGPPGASEDGERGPFAWAAAAGRAARASAKVPAVERSRVRSRTLTAPVRRRRVGPLLAGLAGVVGLTLTGAARAAPAAALPFEGAPLVLLAYPGAGGRVQRVRWGTDWLAEGYANDFGALVLLAPGSAITARFEGGLLTGDAGCNPYAGQYALTGTGGLLRVEAGATATRACAEPPGVMEQEAGYLAALAATQAYRIDGDRLTLWDERGRRLATFVAQAPAGA